MIVTSYRNSKNYGDNWISAGYALWFLRESRYLNGARMPAGYQLRRLAAQASCSAGAGSGEVPAAGTSILLTEDIQFSVDNVIRGREGRLSPRRRPLRRAAHHLPPVLAAADALVSRATCRCSVKYGAPPAPGHLPGQLLLLRYVHGHHARLRPLRRQYPRQPHAGCRRALAGDKPVGGF